MKLQFITGIIIIIVFGSLVFADNPQIHFWKSDYQKNVDWCKVKMPQANISLFDENVAFCYGEWWPDYCKISYPEYCPDNDYSDYDRCIRNCAAYGQLGDCPC